MIPFDVHFENGGLVDQANGGGQRHGLVGKDLVPFAEGLVGGDQQGSALVAGTDQFEQHAGLGPILGDIGEVVADHQMIFVEFGEGGFEVEAASGQLELLDEIGGAGRQIRTVSNGSIRKAGLTPR